MENYILEMRNVTKEYSGVRVLENVCFQVKKGEVHALCGENGAGKSTMMKIISGVINKNEYAGELFINDELAAFSGIADSEKKGISIIHQELALAQDLDVCENIYLGRLPKKNGIIDWNQAYHDTEKILAELTLTEQGIRATDKVSSLSTGQQQLVEIAKSISKNVELLLLDEPTSALTEREVEILMSIIRNLKANGVTCIYISHKLEEISNIADSISILRDGKMVHTDKKENMSEEQIIAHMVGREITNRYPQKDNKVGEKIFEIKNYTVYSKDSSKKVVDNISFCVHRGEVLGISGLMGAGRSELMTSVFGCWKGKHTGNIYMEGKEVEITCPSDAINLGIGMVTEDRKLTGLMLDQSIQMNMTLASLKKLSNRGVINNNKETTESMDYADRMLVKMSSINQKVSALSGGNQQKVVLGKWLMVNPRVLILDEPTRGVDVGAKLEIYTIINELLKEGVAVIMISSELPEILGMSDRVVVMHEGVMKGEFLAKEVTQEDIMECAIL